MSKQDLDKEILSEITIFMKYAKYLPKLQRRETWEEIVTRNKNMHLKKFPKQKRRQCLTYLFEIFT